LDDIHSHWHLSAVPFTVQSLVLEPVVVTGRGWPNRSARSRQPQNSTCRDPSAFERYIGKPTKRTQPIKRAQPIRQVQPTECTQLTECTQPTKRTQPRKQAQSTKCTDKTKQQKGGLSVHWQEDEQSIEGDDSEEDELAERELERLIASEGTALSLWTKEKDLVGMTRVGKVFVQSNMQLRNRQLNAEVRLYIKLFSINILTKFSRTLLSNSLHCSIYLCMERRLVIVSHD
jgi:hypothetical protein